MKARRRCLSGEEPFWLLLLWIRAGRAAELGNFFGNDDLQHRTRMVKFALASGRASRGIVGRCREDKHGVREDFRRGSLTCLQWSSVSRIWKSRTTNCTVTRGMQDRFISSFGKALRNQIIRKYLLPISVNWDIPGIQMVLVFQTSKSILESFWVGLYLQ